MENLITDMNLPEWVLIGLALLWGFNKYIYPVFDLMGTKKAKEIDELKTRIATLEQENQSSREECQELESRLRYLSGAIAGFRIYLKEKGYEDMPTFDDLLNISQ